MKIRRIPLKFIDLQTIVLPKDATILSADIWNGDLVLYAIVDENKENTEPYEILMLLIEQMNHMEIGWHYCGSVNIKAVTAHLFYKATADTISSLPVKKRGRPKKYKTSEV